jgi:hypothetical protein
VPKCAKKAGIGLLEPPPPRNIILLDVDVVPAQQTVDGCVVELVIQNRPSIVFDGILDSRDENNKY